MRLTIRRQAPSLPNISPLVSMGLLSKLNAVPVSGGTLRSLLGVLKRSVDKVKCLGLSGISTSAQSRRYKQCCDVVAADQDRHHRFVRRRRRL